MPPDPGTDFLTSGKRGAGDLPGEDRMGNPVDADAADDAGWVPVRDRFGPRAAWLLAVWFGLVAGLGEVAVLGVQDLIDPVVTVDSIRTNRHYAWMIPLADLAIFAGLGFGLALVAARWPRQVERWGPRLLLFPALVGALLAVRGLHPVAAVLLALGVATKLGGWLAGRPGLMRRVVRVGIPVLLAVVAGVAWWKPGRPAPEHYRVGTPDPDRPNVLLLVLDTVRADHLSLYGYNRPTTPNLKRWAERGIRFDRARATAPWTLPSHASMLTGYWPHQLSADVNHALDDAKPTLAEVLGDRGYATGGFVANTYYCNAWYGVDRGFDRYEDFPENERISALEILRSSTLGGRLARKLGIKLATPGAKESRKSAATINRDALAWVDGLPANQPFFAFLNFYDAHGPYETPPGYTRQFAQPGETAARDEATIHQFEGMARAAPNPADPEATGRVQAVGAEAARIMVDGYDDCIAALDIEIGRLLDTLGARGTLAKTLVIITSDHGEHFGDRGLFGHGNSLYHPLIDVPLIVIPPQRDRPAAPQIVAEPVSLRDIPSTVVDLLDLDMKQRFPGTSLAAHWVGPSPRTDPPLSVVEQQHRFPPSPHIPASLGPLWSLAQAGMTYIRQSDGSEQLYNHATDPLEIWNLAVLPEQAANLARFRASLNRLLQNPAPRQAETANAHLEDQSASRQR